MLCADTLVSDSAAAELTVLVSGREWTHAPKLSLPSEPVTFECSPIIAVGAAGNVHAGNRLVSYLMNWPNINDAPRPSTPMRQHLKAFAVEARIKHGLGTSLLILTEHKCWHVEAEVGFPVAITNVSYSPTAIGAGARYAQPLLDTGQDGIASIFEAARHEISETNFQVDYVSRKPKPKIRRAWRSYSSLVDPSRIERLVRRSTAIVGALLALGGSVAFLAGDNSRFELLISSFVSMTGMVIAGWSMLTFLRDMRNAYYLLTLAGVLVLLSTWKPYSGFVAAHNLEPLILVYVAVLVLFCILRRWRAVTFFYYALHIVGCLALAGLIAAMKYFSEPFFGSTIFKAGIAGIIFGYAVTWLAARYRLKNFNKFGWHFDRHIAR